MPVGMFFISHHEIKGPEIKYSYFNQPIELTKEFISQLYMTHAGFGRSYSLLEMKFDQYQVKSVFTGDVDRRTNLEGILGIIFEEEEVSDNLELFLNRNLSYIIRNQELNSLENIFSKKLNNYLNLLSMFEKIKVEDIQEIFIIGGDESLKNCFLRLSYKRISNSELNDFYEKLINSKKIPNYQYSPLNLNGKSNIFLLIKVAGSDKVIQKIVNYIKFYLEKYFNYSLEILALFLMPHLLISRRFNEDIDKKSLLEKKNILSNLKTSKDYGFEFNKIVIDIINDQQFLEPIRTQT